MIGLTLYNGSVLAEIFRAGIRAKPAGQAEAGYAIGLRKSGVMLRSLLPQAVTVMMSAIVSQLVLLLKDSALGVAVRTRPRLFPWAPVCSRPPRLGSSVWVTGLIGPPLLGCVREKTPGSCP